MSDIWEEDGDPWTVKSVTRAFENDWMAIDSYAVIHPGGAEGTYGVMRPRRLGVGVLPMEADGSVHLVGQWRFPLGRYSWEMPEGGADPGEPALDCARRIATLPPRAAEDTKRILNMHLERAVLATLDFALTAEDRSFTSPELRANIDRLRKGRQ